MKAGLVVAGRISMATPRQKVLKLAILLLAITLTVNVSGGQDEFATKLYEPVELTPRVVSRPAQEVVLHEQQKRAVLDARMVLVRFLKSFSMERADPIAFLTPALRKRFGERAQLYQVLGGESEAYFFKIQVSHFVYRTKAQEIVFYVDLTISSQGEDHTRPTAFAVERVASEWKISRFGSDIRSRELEAAQ
jgi:hypothetical protein